MHVQNQQKQKKSKTKQKKNKKKNNNWTFEFSRTKIQCMEKVARKAVLWQQQFIWM